MHSTDPYSTINRRYSANRVTLDSLACGEHVELSRVRVGRRVLLFIRHADPNPSSIGMVTCVLATDETIDRVVGVQWFWPDQVKAFATALASARKMVEGQDV